MAAFTKRQRNTVKKAPISKLPKSRLNLIFLLLIITFTLVSRVIFLDQFPIGITHDELNYIISAKSLFWDKSFAPGTAPAILPTKMSNYTVTVAEVPTFILSATTSFFPLSLFTGRIVGAIFSIITAILLYLLTKRITNNDKTALISSLLFAINPWGFLMGRSIFEVNFYVVFFLLGLLILIKQQDWKIFYSLPFFLLGFLSYIGGQISFLIFICISLFYHYLSTPNSRSKKIVYATYTTIIFLIFFSYLYLVFHNQTFIARGREISTPFNQEIARTVDSERKLSLEKYKDIFINKGTIYLSNFEQKYLTAFSTNNLFTKGETRAAFSFQKHGTFYAIDAFFMLIGACYLFSLNKKKFALIIGIIGTAPITSALSTVELSYSQRAGLMFPFMIMLSSIGIYYLTTALSSQKLKILLSISVTIIYALSFINLMHLYFSRFPLYASDGWFFQDRVLSQYLALAQKNQADKEIVVITDEPKIIFEEFLFFNNIYNGENIHQINQLLDKKNYSYGKIIFMENCPDGINTNTIYISSYQINCPALKDKNQHPARIADIKENQDLYLIFNDNLCKNQPLNEYFIPTQTEDFQVEKMNENNFCQMWITKNR